MISDRWHPLSGITISGIIPCSHRPVAGRELLDAPQSSDYRIFVRKNFVRRPLRLTRVFDSSPLYFVTFCTHNRIRCLARDEIHSAFILFFAGRAERDFKVAVGRYVIMPDHIHLFVRAEALILSWGGGSGCSNKRLPERILHRERKHAFGKKVFSIMCCEATRVIQKNGITFAKIQCAPDLRSQQNNGRTRVRSFTLIARDCYLGFAGGLRLLKPATRKKLDAPQRRGYR